ncbi:hypothetical protein ABZW30_12035 [Kitasatospora sp. NPDC004669]|uniref:4'-phosphopantetheinyl transferase family protein n=1 Tax=Kitasatospora sp. NPDC004669 TaxID=3154555 RepID=UPI0033A031D4
MSSMLMSTIQPEGRRLASAIVYAMSDVEIWRVPITHGGAAAAEAARFLLDSEELRRLEALDRPIGRGEYLVAHVAMRLVLAERLGCDPHDVVLEREPCIECDGPHGRPMVAETGGAVFPAPYFSLSHRQGLAVIAVSANPVGLGMELADLHTDNSTGAESLDLTARLVREKAYVKGTGLAASSSSAELTAFSLTDPASIPDSLGFWQLATVPVPPGFVAAVAVHTLGDSKTVRLHVGDLDLARALGVT